MAGNEQMWILVITGLIAGATCLVLSVRGGREPPVHFWAWLLGLILLSAGEAFRILIGVTTVIQGSWAEAWPLVGAAAAACILASAVIRPRLAAWFLLGTAIVLPLILVPGLMGWVGLIAADLTPLHVVGFYGLPALVTSALLFVATRPAGRRAPESGRPRVSRHRVA